MIDMLSGIIDEEEARRIHLKALVDDKAKTLRDNCETVRKNYEAMRQDNEALRQDNEVLRKGM